MIQIYSKGNSNFNMNGDMTLIPDDVTLSVELNGVWNLAIHHSIDIEGRWRYIVEDAVVKVPSFNGNQLFRIYSKDKSDAGVSAQAYPIFFDARSDCFLIDVRPTDKNGQNALNVMCAVNPKYSAASNIAKVNTAYYEYMNLIEAISSDSPNSFLNRWGGEILYDNFRIVINDKVGKDAGVELRYGKNISANGIKESVDMSNVVTRIYPKGYNGRKLSTGCVDSSLIENYENIRTATMTFDKVKLRADVDSEDADSTICDTQAQFDAELIRLCKEQFDSGLDKPTVTIEADMVLLKHTEEYKDYMILEDVSLGDVIHCRHDKLGIVTSARVVSLEYDCIRDKVTSIKLGSFEKNYFNDLTSNLQSNSQKVDSVINSNGTLNTTSIQGIIDGSKTQIRTQSTSAYKVSARTLLFENFDRSSEDYGAISIGTNGIEVATSRKIDNSDWIWYRVGTVKGILASSLVGTLQADKISGGNLRLGAIRIENDVLVVSDATGVEVAWFDSNELMTLGKLTSIDDTTFNSLSLEKGKLVAHNADGVVSGEIGCADGKMTVSADSIQIGLGKSGKVQLADGSFIEFKGGVMTGTTAKWIPDAPEPPKPVV